MEKTSRQSVACISELGGYEGIQTTSICEIDRFIIIDTSRPIKWDYLWSIWTSLQ